MKITICQTNTTPADFRGNCEQIIDGINEGKNSDLVVFPELSIPGYLCKDIIFREGFIQKNLDWLNFVAGETLARKCTVVVGYIAANNSGVGKPFRNMAAVIRNGNIIATYQKHLLPFYDVFDEGRYFQPGTELTVVEIGGIRWGICICEDLWNDKGSDDYNYIDNPLESYRRIGVKNIISINSSPFVHDKPYARVRMVKESTAGMVVYCNQYGGQDELVFDGNSFIMDNRDVKALATSTYTHYDTDVHEPCRGDFNNDLYSMIVLGLKDYIRKSGFKRVVIGSSGGIDSALVVCLACDAIGADNVHAIRMPSIFSSDHSKVDAQRLHENLGCHDYLVPINHTPFVDHILTFLQKSNPNPLANENIQARLRGNILMYFSNAWDALLLTTGNKTELALGYATLYGDMNGGFAPINDLYKMQVYKLCRQRNFGLGNAKVIPENILTKAPSAELAPGQTDEASLLPYPILDAIVKSYVEHYVADFNTFKTHDCWRLGDQQVVMNWLKLKDAEELYNRFIRMINNAEFKRRQAAPGIKVSKVAFGVGRRLPIVKGNS
jgi:NAD+ synthetase